MTHEEYWSVALSNCRIFPRHPFGDILELSPYVWDLIFHEDLLIIASSYLCALGPIFFSWSTKTSSPPVTLLSLVMPLLSCTLLRLNGIPCRYLLLLLGVVPTGHFDVDGMLFLSLTMSWCDT